MGIRRVLTAMAVAAVAAGTVGATAAPAGATHSMKRQELTKYERAIAADVNAFWRAEFARYGFGYQAAKVVIVPRKALWKVCEGAIAGDPALNPYAGPAFYCTPEQTVYLSAGWMYDEIYERFGEFGTAVVIGHELGHHIQNLVNAPPVVDKRGELQADCLAGVWTRDAFGRGAIDWYDLAEGGLTLHYLGDYEVNAPGHHGTPKERVDAYSRGVEKGDPTRC